MSRISWVSPETGELVEVPFGATVPSGLVAFEEPTAAELEDARALGDYFTRKLVELDAQAEAAKAQFERSKRRGAAGRKALDRYLPELEAAARTLFVGSGKTAQFAYGSASLRATKRTEVDEEEALAWALENDQGAVKWSDPSLLKSKLSDDCPHKRTVKDESFSVKGAK